MAHRKMVSLESELVVCVVVPSLDDFAENTDSVTGGSDATLRFKLYLQVTDKRIKLNRQVKSKMIKLNRQVTAKLS